MTTAPTELTYGYVDGRLILVIGDSSDAGRMPDPVPATGTTVQITPKQPLIRVAGADPTTVVKQAITCTLDEDGRLLDPAGARGVWLVTGVYAVTYKSTSAAIPSHDIEVTAAHTESAPLDLTLAMPPGGPVLTPSQYAELSARIDGIVVEASGVSSVNGATGAVTLDAADVGALPSSYTPPAPLWADVTGKPATFPPTIGTTATTAKAGNWMPTKADVGLANVDNTSDANKPVSTATQTALDGKASTSHTHTVNQVSDATTVGQNLVKATDAAAARTAIGAGTSNLTLGTTASTAKAGNYTPTWTEVTGKPATFPPDTHGHAYSEITGTPTIPGPQTISLTGSDLTLSDGGGTVTLPAGGGGGGGIQFPVPEPGRYFTSPLLYGGTTNKPKGFTGPARCPGYPTPIMVDEVNIWVDTAGSAGHAAEVVVYAATADGLPGTVISTTTHDVSATGRRGVVVTPFAWPANGVWTTVNLPVAGARLRVANQPPLGITGTGPTAAVAFSLDQGAFVDTNNPGGNPTIVAFRRTT